MRMLNVPIVMVGVWFAMVPLVFWFAYALPTVDIKIQQDHLSELNQCQSENQKILDNREVYCVREFGKPDYSLVIILSILAVIMYASSFYNNYTSQQKVDELKQLKINLQKQEALLVERENRLLVGKKK